MKKIVFLVIFWGLMAENVTINSPKAGDNWFIGWGPYEIRWKFSGFPHPSQVHLSIFANSCEIASRVPLTHGSILWIPWGSCLADGGKIRIKIKWKGGQAESDEFELKPNPLLGIRLLPDSLIYREGESIKLEWKPTSGKGELSIWRWDRKLCSLFAVDLAEGTTSWKVKKQCPANLLGKFVYFRLSFPNGESLISHIFKITGEMPPVRRRW